MSRVYLETSFVSACVTDRTDPASIYRRDVSQEWWRTQRANHETVVSAEVIAELSVPGFGRSEEALWLISREPILAIDAEVVGIAAALVRERVMPGPESAGDALHVAVAAAWGAEYILTWNVRHLANPRKVAHLAFVCRRLGLVPPAIITPDLLWG